MGLDDIAIDGRDRRDQLDHLHTIKEKEAFFSRIERTCDLKTLLALTIVLSAQCLAVFGASPSFAQQPEPCEKDSSTRASTEVPQQCGILSDEITWKAGGPSSADWVVYGGFAEKRSLPICRGSYQDSVHLGMVVNGNCSIGWGGGQILLPTFETMNNSAKQLGWIYGPTIPKAAVISGQTAGVPLFVCHAGYEGNVLPGQVVNGNCSIGWGGKELVLPNFKVLTIGRTSPMWIPAPAPPVGTVMAGDEAAPEGQPNSKQEICRAPHEGGVIPGRVVNGRCSIGWGGKEIALTPYETFWHDGAVLLWWEGLQTVGAVIGGHASGIPLGICTGYYGGVQYPGKVMNRVCSIGLDGKEIVLWEFRMVVQASPH